MRKRGGAASEGGESRLVYSTGGAKPAAATATPATPKGSARAAGGKGIRLRLETRPGGRVVTLVLGLVGTPEQLAEVAAALKSACGTGGTVKDGVVELQGDHRKSAQTALAARGLKSAI
jgi:translation initiation factor 1